ncbi:hypothetical protein SAMN05444161_8381 [Rhizobiales bacterium GAS191]|nr:hypothetical protein SAMN05444161_8381 [Rhizobiales bacterium GAS191]
MNTLITLLVTLAGLSNPSAPQVKPDLMQKCVSDTAAIVGRIRTMTQADPSFEFRGYSEERATQVLDAFNAIPPSTRYAADQIMVLVDTREGGNKEALVMLITTGCAKQVIETPLESWQAVLRQSIGNDT